MGEWIYMPLSVSARLTLCILFSFSFFFGVGVAASLSIYLFNGPELNLKTVWQLKLLIQMKLFCSSLMSDVAPGAGSQFPSVT